MASVKKCVADIASNFTTNRMLNDYEERFYDKLAARKRQLIVDGGYKLAREIAAWKRKVSAAWDQVRAVDVQRVKIDNEADLRRREVPLLEVTGGHRQPPSRGHRRGDGHRTARSSAGRMPT